MLGFVRRIWNHWSFLFHNVPVSGWWVFAIAYLFFCALGLLQLSGVLEGNSFDVAVADWAHSNPALRESWSQKLTKLGDRDLVIRGCAFGVFALFALRKWHYVPALLIGVLGEMWITQHFQDFFGRIRPDFHDGPQINRPGFPSGHTSTATVFYLFWILFAIKEFRRQFAIFATCVLIFVILGVALSRIVLLAHWATDVIAGLSYGIAWMFFWFWINQKMNVMDSSFRNEVPVKTPIDV